MDWNWNEIKIPCNFMRREKNYLVICGKSSIVLPELNEHCLIWIKIEITKMKLEQERINLEEDERNQEKMFYINNLTKRTYYFFNLLTILMTTVLPCPRGVTKFHLSESCHPLSLHPSVSTIYLCFSSKNHFTEFPQLKVNNLKNFL
jgi:hypothetical protein